jgi:hypothetical protein
MQFDSDDTYNILLYGGGALVAVWFSSVIVRSIDSIPLVRICYLFYVNFVLSWYYEQGLNFFLLGKLIDCC